MIAVACSGKILLLRMIISNYCFLLGFLCEIWWMKAFAGMKVVFYQFADSQYVNLFQRLVLISGDYHAKYCVRIVSALISLNVFMKLPYY